MKKHGHAGDGRRSIEDPERVLREAGLAPGESLLDLGSGSGYFALAAAALVGHGGKVCALDAHQPAVQELRNAVKDRGILNLEAVAADATEPLPVPARSVDWCLMSDVLHGFVANCELDRVVANLGKVLKSAGKLLVIDFKKAPSPFGPPAELRLSEDEAARLLSRYGFGETARFEAGPFHYALVLQAV